MTEALAPTITIAGQQVSAADNFLELVDGTLTDADIAAMRRQKISLRWRLLSGLLNG